MESERGFVQEDDSIIGDQLMRERAVVMWTSLTDGQKDCLDLEQ